MARKPTPSKREHRTAKAAAAAVMLSTGTGPGAVQPFATVPNQGVPSGEKGITGTTNWVGDLQTEPNSKLIHQSAYGTPGSRSWGEWEKLWRTDPDVASAMDHVKAQIRDARMDVEPAEGVKNGKAHADFLRWNLTSRMAPGWTEYSQQACNAILYGFSLHEKVAGVVEHELLPNGRGYACVKLAERLPGSIHINGWNKGADGELEFIRQMGQRGSAFESDIRLPARDVLLVTWNRNGDNYAGYSAFRPVWYVCQLRAELLKILAIGSAREALGIPTAEQNDAKAPSLSKAQRSKLMKLLSNSVYHEAAALVMPKGWTVKWWFSPAANKGHVLDLYERLGQLILRLVGAQQMTMGSQKVGSYGASKTHDANSDAFAQGVVATLEGVLNGSGDRPYEGLSRWIIDANWGPQDAYPRIKITLKKAKLPVGELVTSVKTAVDAGALTVTEDVEQSVREALGFAPIDPAEREQLQAEKKAAALAAAKAAQASAKPAAEPDDENDAGDGEGKQAAKAEAPAPKDRAEKLHRLARLPGEPFVPYRPVRPSEQHLDLAAMDDALSRSREEFERGAKPLVVAALVKAMPDVREAMKDGDPSEVAGLKLELGPLADFVGKYLEGLRAEGYRQVGGEFGRAGAVAKKRAEGQQAAVPGVKLAADEGDERDDRGAAPSGDDEAPPATPPSPPRRARDTSAAEAQAQKLLAAKRDWLIRRMRARFISDIEREAIEVIRQGGEPDQVVARVVQRQLETKGLQQDAGTVMTKAFNVGREQFARERGDEVESVELSALLDGKQCGPCSLLDGQEFDFDSAEHQAHVPPLSDICDGGDACRCVLVYNFKEAGFHEVDDG